MFSVTAVTEDGETYIFRTDSESEFIKFNFKEPLTANGGSVAVDDLGEGWVKVTVTYPDEWPAALPNGSFLGGPHEAIQSGFYDLRSNGGDERREWWVIRHRDGLLYC